MTALRARQWSRGAWAAALLLGSVPLVGRMVLGAWEFGAAAELACAALLAAVYLEVRSRRFTTLPDPATYLEQAVRLAAEGRTDRAILVLTKVIRTSPRLWQAYQYRGELRLSAGDDPAGAEEDFAAALRLAPEEAHLRELRERARSRMEAAGDGRR